jgi:hypothetical protein
MSGTVASCNIHDPYCNCKTCIARRQIYLEQNPLPISQIGFHWQGLLGQQQEPLETEYTPEFVHEFWEIMKAIIPSLVRRFGGSDDKD